MNSPIKKTRNRGIGSRDVTCDQIQLICSTMRLVEHINFHLNITLFIIFLYISLHRYILLKNIFTPVANVSSEAVFKAIPTLRQRCPLTRLCTVY
jgi:hypothetical protein